MSEPSKVCMVYIDVLLFVEGDDFSFYHGKSPLDFKPPFGEHFFQPPYANPSGTSLAYMSTCHVDHILHLYGEGKTIPHRIHVW